MARGADGGVAMERSLYDHVIHSQDGRLASTSPVTTVEDVRRMVREAQSSPHGLVLYLHGGLIDRDKGLEGARALLPRFLDAGAYPVFLVWESGLLDSILNSTGGPAGVIIARLVAVFDRLGWAGEAAYLFEAPDGRGGLEARLAVALADDEELRDAVIRAAEAPARERSSIYPDRGGVAGASLSREAYRAFFATDPPIGRFGLDGSAGPSFDPMERLVLFALGVLDSLLARERYGRLHGKSQSVVEEILRRIGLGGRAWESMKAFADHNFVTAEAASGVRDGAMTVLLNELAGWERESGAPARRVTVIAHSAGSIIACNFVDRFREMGLEAQLDVVFLAPAVTHDRFARSLLGEATSTVIHGFRMFTMDDVHERTDDVWGVYGHSLLYLVSGAFEVRSDLRLNVRADVPIVGMRRFAHRQLLTDHAPPRSGWRAQRTPYVTRDEDDAIGIVEDYLSAPTRLVATPTAGKSAPGFESTAQSHSGFAVATLDSLVHIIRHGLPPVGNEGHGPAR